MSIEHRGGGAPNREPTPPQAGRPDQTQAPHQRGEGIRSVPPPQGEHQPHSAHEQQTVDLDPEIERMIRDYAAAEAEGDPKKEKRLLKQYLKDPSFIKTMTDFKLHGPTTLTYSTPDFSRVFKKQEKEE